MLLSYFLRETTNHCTTRNMHLSLISNLFTLRKTYIYIGDSLCLSKAAAGSSPARSWIDNIAGLRTYMASKGNSKAMSLPSSHSKHASGAALSNGQVNGDTRSTLPRKVITKPKTLLVGGSFVKPVEGGTAKGLKAKKHVHEGDVVHHKLKKSGIGSKQRKYKVQCDQQSASSSEIFNTEEEAIYNQSAQIIKSDVIESDCELAGGSDVEVLQSDNIQNWRDAVVTGFLNLEKKYSNQQAFSKIELLKSAYVCWDAAFGLNSISRKWRYNVQRILEDKKTFRQDEHGCYYLVRDINSRNHQEEHKLVWKAKMKVPSIPLIPGEVLRRNGRLFCIKKGKEHPPTWRDTAVAAYRELSCAYKSRTDFTIREIADQVDLSWNEISWSHQYHLQWRGVVRSEIRNGLGKGRSSFEPSSRPGAEPDSWVLCESGISTSKHPSSVQKHCDGQEHADDEDEKGTPEIEEERRYPLDKKARFVYHSCSTESAAQNGNGTPKCSASGETSEIDRASRSRPENARSELLSDYTKTRKYNNKPATIATSADKIGESAVSPCQKSLDAIFSKRLMLGRAAMPTLVEQPSPTPDSFPRLEDVESRFVSSETEDESDEVDSEKAFLGSPCHKN